MDATKPISENQPSTLARHTFSECEAMAKFALSSGLKVPGNLLRRLRALQVAIDSNDNDLTGELMSRLGECHNQLSHLVAPATPRTILLLDSAAGQKTLLRFLGPLPLIRQMMVTALLSLAALIIITLSPNVNGSDHNSNILLGSGLTLLLNEMFLLSAAALGASFSALFIANRYIQEGTFDPRYNVSYWMRFVLGIIAGFILAALIDVDAFQASSNSSVTTPFARPLLAMLGGFSASVVYRILNRLAESVESIFRGDVRDQVRNGIESERNKLKVETEQNRSHLAYRLMALQQKGGSAETVTALQDEINTLVRDLIGEETPDTDTTPAAKATPVKPATVPAQAAH
jgi:hypothetical protein